MRTYDWLIILAAAVGASGAPASSSLYQRDAVNCVTNENGALQITPDCIDTDYALPVFSNETDEESPIPHHLISGYFNGTTIDFKIYLTPKSQWEGRFFQIVYPSQSSTATDNAIIFGVESGGYTIQASGSTGYRADAALAKLSRVVAQEYYNISSSDRIYGYIYGGSGGSFKAIGAVENTYGVWDGCVALIQATPISVPYNWGIRAFGGLIMGNQSTELIDTIQPGGSGDLGSVLGELERAVLKETEELGIPVRGWEDWSGIVGNRTQEWQALKDIAVPMIQSMDPTYADDFWIKDGYAGTDQSELGERFRNALVQFDSTIENATAGVDGLTSEFVLTNVAEKVINVVGLGFSVKVDNISQPFSGQLDVKTRTIYILAGAANTTLQALVPGVHIQVDNRWYLAAHTYYRHQLAPIDRGFYSQNYLRGPHEEPLYPQRDVLVGPLISQASSEGGTHTGNITMKLIVMDNLIDFDAFPWHADWYKNQVEKAKGGLEDHYRLYYNDNADHVMGTIEAPYTSRVVDFTGIYQQHLRDLSAWVENGVSPPTPTNYTVNSGQVKVPSSAFERKGIQPVVKLLVDGSKLSQTLAGESIQFSVQVQAPNGVGQIVAVEWDPLGVGDYSKKDFEIGSEVDLQFSYAYAIPGIYFAGIRAAAHREGNNETDIALAWNLDRVRVVVE